MRVPFSEYRISRNCSVSREFSRDDLSKEYRVDSDVSPSSPAAVFSPGSGGGEHPKSEFARGRGLSHGEKKKKSKNSP